MHAEKMYMIPNSNIQIPSFPAQHQFLVFSTTSNMIMNCTIPSPLACSVDTCNSEDIMECWNLNASLTVECILNMWYNLNVRKTNSIHKKTYQKKETKIGHQQNTCLISINQNNPLSLESTPKTINELHPLDKHN